MSGKGKKRNSGGAASSSKVDRASETTPLLGGGQLGLPVATTGEGGPVCRGGRSGDEIDPNDFDILLSKSLPGVGGFLEPESLENSLLRGVRRYSSTSSRRPSAVSNSHSVRHRPSIPGLTTEDDETAVFDTTPLVSDSPATETDRLISREVDDENDDDLDTDTDSTSKPATPYLNNISVSRFWFIFAEILMTYFIACFDGTIMASSHPVITSYFHSSNSASWLSTAFLLTSTAFQPFLGRLSDSVGRKVPYLVTMVIFALSTLWCALATSMTSFIIARAACGIGAGGMMTLGSIIISDMVPIETRGTYQAYININYGVGSTLGAALGGAMADHLGWRWEFGVQVIPLLLCVVIAAVAIPNDLGLQGQRQTLLEALKVFDFRGSFLLTTSLTFFVLGLNLGGNVLPWSHPFVVSSLVISTVGFPAFLYSQTLAIRPIMPLRLITKSPHANLIFSNSCASFLLNAITFNIPLFFQAVLLTSATTSGLRLMVPSIVSSTAGAATGLIITRDRRLKWTLVAGTALFLIGCICLAFLRRGWPDFLYLLVLVPYSLGQGFQFPGSLMSVLATSEQADQAVVTTTLILWRSVGVVLGVSGSSLIVQNSLVRYLDRFVTGEMKHEVIEKVRSSVEAVVKLEGHYREEVIMSYEAALRLMFSCCTALAIVSLCLVLPVKLPRLGQRK